MWTFKLLHFFIKGISGNVCDALSMILLTSYYEISAAIDTVVMNGQISCQ